MDTSVASFVRIDSSIHIDNQNKSGENQQHAPATPLPNFQGDKDESYSDTETKNTYVAPIPHQREHVQVPLVHSGPIVTAMQQHLDTFKKFMATVFPTSIAPVAPTTKMSFSDQLDAFQQTADAFPNSLIVKARDWYMAFPLKTIDAYQQTTDAFVAKFAIAVQKRHDERILMDIQQGKNEYLRAYHSRYNNLLVNIPMVDDKVTYMAFFKVLHYGKLKKALLVRTPLMKDELKAAVTTHIKLEELKVGAVQPVNFKRNSVEEIWERVAKEAACLGENTSR
ncbi:hypothetical protein LIER_39112 [Lithospermum erythrorhizon]|uniref:Retrotransposon gag domain-containing protein n=1 Tax=Lithospermum erythrorhizon TaxID=34254 RepID=A0AAV3QE43_LITER